MKYAELIPPVLILALRLLRESPRAWAGDWVAVLAMLWIALALTREESKPRRWAVALSCAWLAAIYAVAQAPGLFKS